LTHLDISDCELAQCVARSSALVPLTSLVSLGLHCSTVGLSILPGLHLEAFQSLTLRRAKGNVSFLQRAAGLTALEFIGCRLAAQRPHGLDAALSAMSRLRYLLLSIHEELEAPNPFQLAPVLQDLTTLTRLRYTGNFIGRSDMEACASLSELRSLWLVEHPEVTPAYFPALQAMSGLTKLTLWGTGILPEHMTTEVRTGFDVERLRCGWPRLKTNVKK
jgi:hypothetical protein